MNHYLLIGLGNIGPEYENTRHNIGFKIVDKVASDHEASFELSRLAFKSEVSYKGKKIHLIKPTTYMNLSGKAVSYWLSHLKIPIERSLVIVDDLALPFGKLRMRAKGSSAGHNGLRSIEEAINTQNYPRLKFGIGDHFPKGKQADYVLSDFTKTEQATIPLLIDRSYAMIINFCMLGIEKAMSLSSTSD